MPSLRATSTTVVLAGPYWRSRSSAAPRMRSRVSCARKSEARLSCTLSILLLMGGGALTVEHAHLIGGIPFPRDLFGRHRPLDPRQFVRCQRDLQGAQR